jgi:predicted Zn-dependent protease
MGYMRYAQIAAYGRNQERDADRGGLTMAAKAGWNPMGMATFLQDLGNTERLMRGWSRLPGYFDSHPGSAERAATAAQMADTIEWKPAPSVAGSQEAFLQKLVGLTIGPNPKEGVFVGDRFLHPDMGFTILFPKDWFMVNTSEAVGAVAPRGEAQFFLMFGGPGEDAEAVGRRFIEGELKQQRGKVLRMLPMKIGPYEAFRIEAQMPGAGGSLYAQITFVAFDDVVFRLNGITTAGSAEKFTGRFQTAARTFRAITAEERDEVKILRLAVVQAQRGETLVGLSARTGNALPLPETGVLNDLFLDTPLVEGQFVKIGRAEPYRPSTPKRAAEEPEAVPDPGS